MEIGKYDGETRRCLLLKIKNNDEQRIFVIPFTETLHYIFHSRRREIDMMNLERKGYFCKKD
ncbi:hypothetical protein [Bartonella grahamii]|uniref:Uncharacterized protein n=1 Tax=Bartonella grahamii TaxID=33045 RepID=A0A336NDS9_BARGR|nr:hypothetical protein [Bartonella grahamii]SSZ39769.1 Uncharacterised protein [Bartonella grahamii]